MNSSKHSRISKNVYFLLKNQIILDSEEYYVFKEWILLFPEYSWFTSISDQFFSGFSKFWISLYLVCRKNSAPCERAMIVIPYPPIFGTNMFNNEEQYQLKCLFLLFFFLSFSAYHIGVYKVGVYIIHSCLMENISVFLQIFLMIFFSKAMITIMSRQFLCL